MKISGKSILTGFLISVVLLNVKAQQQPDAIFPIPSNIESEPLEGINLFTGNVGRTVNLMALSGSRIRYDLSAYYNSASAYLINADSSNFQPNTLGGYGWKLMDYPKLVEDGGVHYLLDGMAAHPLHAVGNNAYSPGGKMYLWRVLDHGNDNWEIAKGNGEHFLFNHAPIVQSNGSKVWNFSSFKNAVWNDSISFNYTREGYLSGMFNGTGDTILLNYDGVDVSSVKTLNQLVHRKNGGTIAVLKLTYSPIVSGNGRTYTVLSEIAHHHHISAQHFSQLQSSTKFAYLQTDATPPLGGANYCGALSQLTTPLGAIYTYSYQPTEAGGLKGYVVSQLAVNDGYNNRSGGVFDPNTYTAIQYDTSNVYVSNKSIYRQYNLVYVAPGGRCNTSAPRDAYPYGNLEYYFINGQAGAQLKGVPADYSLTGITNPTLFGVLYQKKVNSDSLVQNELEEQESIINYWAAGQLDGGNAIFFPKLTTTYDEKYGVGRWVSYTYGTKYQLPLTIATARRNPEPNNVRLNRDSLITKLTYAFQQYPGLATDSIYLINTTAKTTKLVQEDMEGTFGVTSCECIQWNRWSKEGVPTNTDGMWAPWRYVAMRDSSADTAACFSSGVNGSTNQWLIQGTVNKRGAYGRVVDSSGSAGNAYSVVLSNALNGARPVAVFKNARAENTTLVQTTNAAYLGFESYEKPYQETWTASSAVINTNRAHTGVNSFSGELTRTFTPADRSGRFYVLGVWTRVAATGDKCTITLKNRKGKIIASNQATYSVGKPTLRYIEASAFIESGEVVTVTLTTAENAFIDDVTFMPADANAEMMVYDMDRNIQIAKLGINGATTHLVHNRFNSLVAQVGPGSIQNVNNLTIPYNSRRGNRFVNGKDNFDPTFPNMQLIASAKSGGTWQGFQYSSNHSFPVQNLKNMHIEDDWLVATAANASATFSGEVDTANLALYTEIFPNDLANGEEIGFAVQLDSFDVQGQLIATKELRFVMTNSALKLYAGNIIYESLNIAEVLNSTSLLLEVAGYNHLFGYANGRSVFDHLFPYCKIRGPVQLITNNAGAAFDNFIFIASPTISQETSDAINRSKQRLVRLNKEEISISEILYGGPLNLPMAQTRQAIIGGDNNNNLGLSYKADFAPGFDYDSMTVADTSVLRTAANYDNPFSKSIRYTKNPVVQVQSVGGGGKFTVGEKGGHYTTFNYDEEAGNIFDYTQDELLVTTKKEPNGVKVYTFSNREMITFGEARIDSTDTLRTQYEYDNHLRLSKVYHPNYYDQQLGNRSAFVMEFEYDFIGNKVSERTPDAGKKQFVYDLHGRLRFSMDAAGQAAEPNEVVYTKYDGLGRVVEQGVMNQKWNADSLQFYADRDAAYPSAVQPGTAKYVWRKLFTYDGNGKAPNQGMLTAVATNWDNDNVPDVTESFKYDEYGNTIEKGLTVKGVDATERKVQYQYDLENRITEIHFPGTSHPGIVYSYNGSNQLVGVGIPGNSDYYAAYEYGYETIEYLNNRSFARTYEHNEAGWTTAINDALFSEELSYEHYEANKDSSYDYNGKIAELSTTMKWSELTIKADIDYDNNARITRANYGASNPWSLGLLSPMAYDHNGNVLSLQRGNNPAYQFEYNAGTNQTKTIQGFTEDYAYNGNGAITAMPYGIKDLRYDPVSSLVLIASYQGVAVNYQYNGSNQRVLKQVQYSGTANSKRLYVHGLSEYPLMEVFKDSSGVSRTTFYIYGPKGLIAAQQDDERLFMLKDHLGSVRVVMDTNNEVKAYFNYSAFGTTMFENIDTSIAHFSLNYRYTGQEIENELGGIYNYRARLYDPGTARFLSPDPKMQYPSPYQYVGNNPINQVDPTGEWGIWSTIATAAVAIAVTAAVIVAAPVTAPALVVLGGAFIAGTAAGAAAGAVAGSINGDGAGKGLLYGAGIGAVASGLTIAAVTGGAALIGGGYEAVATSSGAVAEKAGAAVLESGVSTLAKYALGVGVVGALGGFTGTVIEEGKGTPTPINARQDGISKPVPITASDLGLPASRKIEGYASTIDLTKANVVIPNDQFTVNCHASNYQSCREKKKYPLRALKRKSFQKAPSLQNEDWTILYPDVSLMINASFFLVDYSDPTCKVRIYDEYCSTIQGVVVSDIDPKKKFVYHNTLRKDWTNPLTTVTYPLDILAFYTYPSQHANKLAQLIPYNDARFYNSTFLQDSLTNAIAGMYFYRNGDTITFPDQNQPKGKKVIQRDEEHARTCIGVSDDGKTLLILEAQDVTVFETIYYFKSKGYNNILTVDGGGSSTFYYSKNSSTPIMNPPTDGTYWNRTTGKWLPPWRYRPVINFIGFN